MKKLLDGISEFRQKMRPSYREKFARLALGQSPDCLFFACADSRVVPNLFASTEPGDLFVVRNVGNLVPPCDAQGLSMTDRSEGAAIEFALNVLHVRDIVVCGHSECGAIRAMMAGNIPTDSPNLREWLDVGKNTLKHPKTVGAGLAEHNQLSQINVLQQLEHLQSYPAVSQGLKNGRLNLHAWWFDLANAEVLSFDQTHGRFIPIGEAP